MNNNDAPLLLIPVPTGFISLHPQPVFLLCMYNTSSTNSSVARVNPGVSCGAGTGVCAGEGGFSGVCVLSSLFTAGLMTGIAVMAKGEKWSVVALYRV